ncbi:MAG: methylated-DNA--[protein]-cysteine S-methyltransferase [Hyphomicrobiales bacterium]|nr:methylated-DNA--[protein]-cysteine S-methyltransferase [Hyphomicrobiales bacterium]
MQGYGATFFETAVGVCGLAWSGRGVTMVALPEQTPEATRARIKKRAGAPLEREPPAQIAEIVCRIAALLDGAIVDLSDVALDLDRIGAFERQIYEVARFIPCGQTRTYGEIARAIGEPNGARDVGQALGRNPIPIIVPCHRVVAAGGKTGGFSAPGGVSTKLRILDIERDAATRAGLAPREPQLRLI